MREAEGGRRGAGRRVTMFAGNGQASGPGAGLGGVRQLRWRSPRRVQDAQLDWQWRSLVVVLPLQVGRLIAGRE